MMTPTGSGGVVVSAFGPSPFTCPRCDAPSAPSRDVQTCARCGGAFTLHAGAAHDASIVVPPPNALVPIVKVRSAGLATHHFGVIEPLGVAEGELDPIIASVAMDKSGVAWGDVVSIAVWRKPDWVELVVAILLAAPFALGFLVGSFALPVLFVVSVPLTLLTAWMIHRAVKVQRNYARIVGRYRTITIRFDRPGRRRRLFHSELLRRAGLPDAPIP
ncbi:MAG: hypothetical protein KC657_30795 [Myxococcales bacterium]|nr:hypothetical protein [Myxococcales bacterium]